MSELIRIPRPTPELVRDKDLWQFYGILLSMADRDGVVTVSLRNLTRETKLSLQTVRTFIYKLTATQKVTQGVTQGVTQLSICGSVSKLKQVTQKVTQQSTQQSTQLTAQPQDGFERFRTYFNATVEHTPIRQVRTLSEARKKTLRSIFREFGKDTVEEALAKVVASRWCCGENDKGWVASFDWIFKKTSFIKILEGNYDNRTRPAASADSSASRKESRDRLRSLAAGVVSQSSGKLLDLYNGGVKDSDNRQDQKQNIAQ